uniref:Uncharacterized protein n=1 Tax=Meloidogyne incognita TaxID=6306 RepID=A0A914P5B6_MELIC
MTSASECLSRHISIYLPEMYSRINFCTLLYLQNNKDKQNEISADMEKIVGMDPETKSTDQGVSDHKAKQKDQAFNRLTKEIQPFLASVRDLPPCDGIEPRELVYTTSVQEITNVKEQYEHLGNAYNETVEGYKEIKDMTKGGKKHPSGISTKRLLKLLDTIIADMEKIRDYVTNPYNEKQTIRNEDVGTSGQFQHKQGQSGQGKHKQIHSGQDKHKQGHSGQDKHEQRQSGQGKQKQNQSGLGKHEQGQSGQSKDEQRQSGYGEHEQGHSGQEKHEQGPQYDKANNKAKL